MRRFLLIPLISALLLCCTSPAPASGVTYSRSFSSFSSGHRVSVGFGGYAGPSLYSTSYSFAYPQVSSFAVPVALAPTVIQALPQVQYIQPQVQYVQPQVQYVQPQVQYAQPQTYSEPPPAVQFQGAAVDPCAVSYGTYGAAPVALSTGYTASVATVQGYGLARVYQNSFGVPHMFNRFNNTFVSVPRDRVFFGNQNHVGFGNQNRFGFGNQNQVGVANVNVSLAAVNRQRFAFANRGIGGGVSSAINVNVAQQQVGRQAVTNVRQRQGLLGNVTTIRTR